jgi:threonine synthase
MQFVSTSGSAPRADLATAVFQGLAPDGGLYLPERLDPLSPAVLESFRGAPFEQVALVLARHLLGQDLPAEVLERVVREALDFPVPLVALGRGRYALELFHGPTCAFKDVGARFMARVMAALRRGGPQAEDRPLTVLVATSGDTGSAVAHAFYGLPSVRVFVLYPWGKVSPLQERQFTTLGGNITAVAVNGTFDDCQRLVKRALSDPELSDLDLTSANSINVGRLLPQIFYYFHAWGQLPETPAQLVISVPSGNFGNLTAGLMAKRLGLPVNRFVAATNVNDVVPEYLETGRFAPRPSVATLSNAMDVGNPSNFARIVALYGGDRAALRADVEGSAHDDDQTRAAISRVFAETGYILDPHSAVAWLGLSRALQERPEATGIFLATAHPAKFAEVVEPAIGRPVPLPPQLAACLGKEPEVVRLEPELDALKALLTGPVQRPHHA